MAALQFEEKRQASDFWKGTASRPCC